MKRKRFTEEQIIGILKEHELGAKTADLCRAHRPYIQRMAKSRSFCFTPAGLLCISVASPRNRIGQPPRQASGRGAVARRTSTAAFVKRSA
jgi:hypothetical protein